MAQGINRSRRRFADIDDRRRTGGVDYCVEVVLYLCGAERLLVEAQDGNVALESGHTADIHTAIGARQARFAAAGPVVERGRRLILGNQRAVDIKPHGIGAAAGEIALVDTHHLDEFSADIGQQCTEISTGGYRGSAILDDETQVVEYGIAVNVGNRDRGAVSAATGLVYNVAVGQIGWP